MFQPLPQTLCILALTLRSFFPAGDLALPAHAPGDPVFVYPGYTLQYNETFEQADWVVYELTKEEVEGTAAERSDKFRSDSAIPTGSATDADYKKSGYDRGHLAPAADMKFSEEAMTTCFLYSNMSPQAPAFNRGIWASLEAMVRFWAVENGAVLVATGPVLDKDEYPAIGPNEVAVPEFFYKVVLDNTPPERKGIAYVLPNAAPEKPLSAYACSIDRAEEITGIDFFPLLDDPTERLLEAAFNTALWPQTEFRPAPRQKKQ